jgi:hypothetical protein
MLSKYKVFIWNTLFFLIICICLAFIFPLLLNHEQPKITEKEILPPVKEQGTIRKIWKRGKYESLTTIVETSSSFDLNEEKSHSGDSWVSINWSKKK